MMNLTFYLTCADDGSVNEYVYVYVYIYMYLYMCMYMYVYMYVCIIMYSINLFENNLHIILSLYALTQSVMLYKLCVLR
jgi:hypothetical protein